MACLGPFCGYFRDELRGDSDEDDEDEEGDENKASSKMTGKKTKKSTRRRWRKPKEQKDDESRGGGSAKMRWAQYLHQANVKVKARGGMEMVQQVSEIRVDGNQNLTHGMMKCISQLPKLHAIEIIRCHVEEIPPSLGDCDSLAILRMSHNRLRNFSEDFAKCVRIEQIIVDWNDISEIGQGIFSTRTFAHLEVVNVSHNALSMLPSDFGTTTKPNLIRLIELSNNNLAVLPDSILNCVRLEELNVSHNRLKQLPNEFGKLTKLQRLYVSFNELQCLPADIGRCIQLSKVRIISNQIRELPDSIVDLWPKKPGGSNGRLVQFLVERNPLVMPSITSFEMDGGSIDRAFQLLYEHVAEKRAKQLEQKPEALAVEDQRRPRMAIEDTSEGLGGVTREDSAMSMENTFNSEATPEPPQNEEGGTADFYFGHCSGDTQKIQEIRDAESTLLLIKKNMFLQAQRKLAEEAQENEEGVPATLQIFLDPEYMDKFQGVVPVRDVDIYFNLLVFAMKPHFPTCYQLFMRFEDGDKGYLTREEFHEFCLCVPIHIDEVVRDQMWQLLSFRRNDRVTLPDFVAAWHIHDIESQDPFVASMAKVLQLDYYDMSPKELHDRIVSKGARDATPQLDFDNPEEQPDLRANAPSLLDTEGLRNLQKRLEKAAERVEQARNGRPHTHKEKNGNQHLVSLTDTQYHASLRNEVREDTHENASSEDDEDDGVLSEASNTEESEFDGIAAMRKEEKTRQRLEAAGPAGRLNIDSDEAIQKLMDMPMESFFAPLDILTDAEEVTAQAPKLDQEDKKPGKTDIMVVRRALRQVYRNMPHNDFVSLVSYLLRALQLIRHQGGHVWWHADDPSFAHVLGKKGTNMYTRSLLLHLGFVRLTEVHWVWPNPVYDTPHRVVSKDVDKSDLDTMIVLLKSCQSALYKSGTSFSGHFPVLR